jgi:hypothetical protein
MPWEKTKKFVMFFHQLIKLLILKRFEKETLGKSSKKLGHEKEVFRRQVCAQSFG